MISRSALVARCLVLSSTALLLSSCGSRSGFGTPSTSPTLPSTQATPPQLLGAPLPPGKRVLPPPPTIPGLKFPMGGANPTAMNAVVAYRNLTYSRPLFLTYPPDGSDRIFVVEQSGRIYVSPNDEFTTRKALFLDIAARVNSAGNEEGLLGLAFDPDYKNNGLLYVNYTYAPSSTRYTRISRFTVSSSNPDAADPNSEFVLLTQTQPNTNHNGGMLAFGPDGYLYAGFGDGGGSGDPRGNGQNLGTWLASIIRIDVHGKTGSLNYGIPSDNPFVSTAGAQPEIWAYGLRNPWRFSFDRNTGALWCGDVGQGAREEIDIIVRGGNYGWRYREGFVAYSGTPPPGFQEVKPIVDYGRSLGTSVTGGYVYRGSRVPELRGVYLYADYTTGRIWALVYQNGQVVSNTQIATVSSITSFGEDRDGEVYVVSRGGSIYTLVPRTPSSDPPFPKTLSATGLFVDTATLTPNPNLMPYSVAESYWSDDAIKARWFALAPNSRIGFQPTADWTWPLGSVLLQHFELPTTPGRPPTTTRLETRVLLHERDGWAGYVYKWNPQQDDAELLPGADTRPVTVQDPSAPNGSRVQTWHFPGRSNCLQCHTQVHGYVLGLNTRQLNHRVRYRTPWLVDNQLEAYDGLSLFSAPIGAASQYDAYSSSQDPLATLDRRARTYLAVNCAQCHQPGGPGSGGFDLRYDTPWLGTGLRDALPQQGSLGLPNARLVAPGNKASSVLWERLRRLDDTRMPPLGSHRVDDAAVELIGRWIDQLK